MRALFLCLAALCSLPCLGGGLTFETTDQEVFAKADQGTITVDFPFENKSDSSVTIKSSEASCSCLAVQVKGGKMRYAPGESGVIRGILDMGNFSGEAVKALQVSLEGDPVGKPSISLIARVHIPELVKIEPKTLRWDLGSEATAKVLTITIDHDEPIHVRKAACSNKQFEVEVREVESGKAYELVVTPTSVEEQALGVITIDTDCPIKRHATQRAFALVRRVRTPEIRQ